MNEGGRLQCAAGIQGSETFFLLEFEKLEVNGKTTQSTATQLWKPPPENFYKINTDGAFRNAEKDGAWGFVIRDCQGHGILAGAGHLNVVHDALAAEGEAVLAALKAAMDFGISRVAVETDSSNLVIALTSDKFDQAPGGVIYKELRMLLAMYFIPLSISYVSRFSNQCAHELARYGLQRDPDQPVIWSDPLPNFLQTVLDRDLADPVMGE